jgi:hypothetical protein
MVFLTILLHFDCHKTIVLTLLASNICSLESECQNHTTFHDHVVNLNWWKSYAWLIYVATCYGSQAKAFNKYHVVDFLSWKSLGHLAFEYPN